MSLQDVAETQRIMNAMLDWMDKQDCAEERIPPQEIIYSNNNGFSHIRDYDLDSQSY
jgi:hypothetical protein